MAHTGIAIHTTAKLAVGETAVAVNGGTSQSAHGMSIEADDGNANNIFIGDSNVTTDRYITKLDAGESWEWNPGEGLWIDIATVYCIADAASQNAQVGYY